MKRARRGNIIQIASRRSRCPPIAIGRRRELNPTKCATYGAFLVDYQAERNRECATRVLTSCRREKEETRVEKLLQDELITRRRLGQFLLFGFQ